MKCPLADTLGDRQLIIALLRVAVKVRGIALGFPKPFRGIT